MIGLGAGWRSLDLRWVIRPTPVAVETTAAWQLIDMYPPDQLVPQTEGSFATADQAKGYAHNDQIDRWLETLTCK